MTIFEFMIYIRCNCGFRDIIGYDTIEFAINTNENSVSVMVMYISVI